jgi:ATP adenylyltransferase
VPEGNHMESLWAPWRMEFIRGDRDGACFLCEAAAADPDRDRELLVLARGAKSFVIMNRYPYNNGHLLVSPYRHEGDLGAFEDDELREMMRFLQAADRIVRAEMRAEGVNIGLNLGRAAGAGVLGHLHFHIVPRWVGDTNFMPVIAGTDTFPQALDELWEELRPRFDEAAGEIAG